MPYVFREEGVLRELIRDGLKGARAKRSPGVGEGGEGGVREEEEDERTERYNFGGINGGCVRALDAA